MKVVLDHLGVKENRWPFWTRLRMAWRVFRFGCPYVVLRPGARVERVEFHGVLFAGEDGSASFQRCLFNGCDPAAGMVPVDKTQWADLSSRFEAHLRTLDMVEQGGKN